MSPDGNGSGPQDPEPEELGQPPDSEAVASRAAGRPPEEVSSDNPEAQAKTILEESEERIADGARSADPVDEPFPKPSEDQLDEEGAN
jgi:hypothetical protein